MLHLDGLQSEISLFKEVPSRKLHRVEVRAGHPTVGGTSTFPPSNSGLERAKRTWSIFTYLGRCFSSLNENGCSSAALRDNYIFDR